MITTRAFVLKASDEPRKVKHESPLVFECDSLDEAHKFAVDNEQTLKPGERFDIYYRYEENPQAYTYCGEFK